MRVMVLVKANPESEAGKLPSAEALRAMGKFNEQLAKAGVMEAGEGLHPSSRGVRMRVTESGQKVIDGPFAETKELLAGFWILQVKSMQEAIEWMKRVPTEPGGAMELEIRQVFAPEDFGDLVQQVPEVFEAEERMRSAGPVRHPA